MKKTLIALAAIAAVGAASAQATISGEFAYGYLSTADNTKAVASGFGIDTALVNIKAGEDLGGGMRVDAAMSVSTAGGNGSATGDAQSLTLTTPVGVLSLVTLKPGDWVTGASGGATWYGLDNKVLSARSWRDAATLTVPLSSAVSLSAGYFEPANVIGEGTGTDGNTAQSVYNLGAKYSANGLTVTAAYLPYNSSTTAATSAVTATRLGGNYDMGVVKVGAAVQVVKYGDGMVGTQTALSASAPLSGKFSVNAMFASNNTSTIAGSVAAGLEGSRTGYMLGAQYNMSKRTYAILNNATWTGASATANHTATSTMTALTLVHDF